jgi:flavodoxin
MFEVIYYSRTGHTRKVAEAIADELGVTARDVKNVNTVPDDAYLVLGTGVYAGKFPQELTDFLTLNEMVGRKIALVTTSCFGSKAEQATIESNFVNKGAVIDVKYTCRGQFLGMQRGHPNTEDIAEARKFARSLAGAKARRKAVAVG